MRMAWSLGLAGLIPFAAGLFIVLTSPGGVLLVGPSRLIGSQVLLSYGAIILSFMGAIHWGAGMVREPDRSWPYAVAVLPALFAWGFWGLSLLNPAATPLVMVALALGFVGLLIFDVMRAAAGDFPAWYPRLRLILTSGAAGSLLAAGFFSA